MEHLHLPHIDWQWLAGLVGAFFGGLFAAFTHRARRVADPLKPLAARSEKGFREGMLDLLDERTRQFHACEDERELLAGRVAGLELEVEHMKAKMGPAGA